MAGINLPRINLFLQVTYLGAHEGDQSNFREKKEVMFSLQVWLQYWEIYNSALST